MSGPIVVVAYFHPAEGSRERVLEILEAATPVVHQEPGCELYAFHDSPDGTIVLIEKWESVAAIDAHGSGPAVAKLRADLDGLLASPITSTRLLPRPMGETDRGAL